MKKNKDLFFSITMIILIIVVTMMECIQISKDNVVHSEVSTTEQVVEVNSDDNKTESSAQNTEIVVITESTTITEGTTTTESTTTGTEDVDKYTEKDYQKNEIISSIIETMSIEEKVGQMFFIKNDGRFGPEILEDYPVGGIILFEGDLTGKTSDSLRKFTESFQEKSSLPLLIGTDEEGGTVNRVSLFPKLADRPYQSPRAIYASGGFDLIEEDTHNKSKLLLSYGINVNFAPVCDLAGNKRDYMYNRSFSGDAELTSEYVSLVVAAMNDEKIGSVLKHFPGYGNNGDTHKNIIRDKRAYDVFETEDFKPFIAGISEGADCILVSHNIVECMDEEWPASLSVEVHRLLRNELSFNGVIITDDLMMEGVSDYVSEEESAVQAILAGNDMILSTYYDIQYNAVIEAVQKGIISEARLDDSLVKILGWKYDLGLLNK